MKGVRDNLTSRPTAEAAGKLRILCAAADCHGRIHRGVSGESGPTGADRAAQANPATASDPTATGQLATVFRGILFLGCRTDKWVAIDTGSSLAGWSMMSEKFNQLYDFLCCQMRMTHIYQLVMLIQLRWAGGSWGPIRGRLALSLYQNLPAKSSQYGMLRPTTRKSVGDAKGTPGFIPGVPLGTADAGTGLNPAPASFHFRKDFPTSRAQPMSVSGHLMYRGRRYIGSVMLTDVLDPPTPGHHLDLVRDVPHPQGEVVGGTGAAPVLDEGAGVRWKRQRALDVFAANRSGSTRYGPAVLLPGSQSTPRVRISPTLGMPSFPVVVETEGQVGV